MEMFNKWCLCSKEFKENNLIREDNVYVLDTNFAADLTIMEEGFELIERLLMLTRFPDASILCVPELAPE